ncbi:MAG: alpha/beta fold hydrolase [Vicinamibacterales bacterium]
MIDIGHGEPVVLIPGLQGRWEWMQPAVEGLVRRHRVIAYSLCDERTSPFDCDPALGFENYVRQVGAAMDRAGLREATVIGVSYGGLIATEFAARFPGRVSHLVLASALPTDWTPDRRARFYLRAPRLLSPVFVITAPMRLQPEVRAAFPAIGDRLRFMARHGWRVTTAPMSPTKMARRLEWAEHHRFADATHVQAPTLVVTGEPGLDRVVPVEVSRRNVARLAHARHVVLPRTGHLGIVTKPEGFCKVLDEFVGAHACAVGGGAADAGRVGKSVPASAPPPQGTRVAW